MKKLPLTIILFVLATNPASAQLDSILRGLGNLPSAAGSAGGGLTDAKIGSGLQEALKVGSENAVGQTSAVDGFLRNQAIKILMPESLRSIERPLRLVAVRAREHGSRGQDGNRRGPAPRSAR